jgi:hypothetical protein
MATIDTLIQARVLAPAGLVSGEAAIWNGTTWARSSVTGLSPSGIAGFPADVTKSLRGDGTWAKDVQSFNARQGAVVPASGDYTAAMVTNAPDLSSAAAQVFSGNVQAPAFWIGPSGTAGSVGMITGGTAIMELYSPGESSFYLYVGASGQTGYIKSAGNGLVLGQTTSDKLGFFGKAPIVQPTAAGLQGTVVLGTGQSATIDTKFEGSTGTSAYTVGDIVTSLKNLGILAA